MRSDQSKGEVFKNQCSPVVGDDDHGNTAMITPSLEGSAGTLISLPL